MRKILALMCLIVLICSMACVSASDMNQTVDDTSANDESLGSADSGTFTDLEKKIVDAQEGSTLTLENDYAYNDGFSKLGILIAKSLTIDGNGYTIDAKNSGRVFNILSLTAKPVTLKNINFINGNSSTGGVIEAVNSKITIENCTFINNTASAGGAIHLLFSQLSIDNSQFVNNSIISDDSLNCGAAICIYGQGDFTISNSVFNDNAAKDYLQIDEDGIVSLQSSDGIADHQIEVVIDWGDFPTITFTNVSCNEFKNQSFVFKEKDVNYGLDNKTVRFEVYKDGALLINTTNVTKNGVAQIDYSSLNVGYYLLKTYYNNLTGEATIKVRRDSHFTMSVDDIKIGDDLIIYFDISPEIEGYGEVMGFYSIWFGHGPQYDDLPVYDGKFNFKDKNITIFYPFSGNYTVQLDFLGDDNFYPKYLSETFNIYPADYNATGEKTIIKVDDFSKNYGENKRLYFDLTDINSNPLKNKEISIKVNGVTYKRTTNDNGRSSIAINLNPDQYWAFVSFEGDSVYAPSANTSLVTVHSTISSLDYMQKYCKGPEPFEAQFFDMNGNNLTGGMATFNINGVMYERKISSESYAKLNINLDHGEYIITATNPVTGEMKASTIQILPTIIDNHDLVKYYMNDSQYVVKLDGEGLIWLAEKVTFNINGVFYDRYADLFGNVKLNINLQPGEYIITAEHKGCRVANKITVLPVLSASDLNMKYKDGSKFEAKLLDGQGNPYAGQKVTFNVNGVFYYRTTDVNGIARLNINLMAGEYIITSSYSGMNIANKITISS